MKRRVQVLLSFGPPLLVVLALLAAQHRQSSEQVQALPAVLVGSGLIMSSAIGRRRRRGRLLQALRLSRAQPE